MGDADISVNSCAAHTVTVIIVEVTSWDEERASSQLWGGEEANTVHKCVFVSWLRTIQAMNIGVCDNVRIITTVLSSSSFTHNAETLREAERSRSMKT